MADIGWDWTSPQNDRLWQDAIKTLYDPCPSGWRVPKGGEGRLSPWNGFSVDNSSYANSGRLWTAAVVHGGTAWYCACGIRTMDYSGRIGYMGNGYYSAATVSGIRPSRLRFDSATVVPTNYTGARADGHPVRCIRE